MPHFFINSKSLNADYITICDKDNYSHLTRSLRIKTGESLLLIDENEIQYETVIEKISSNEIKTKILKSYKSARKLDYDIYLAQCVLKTDTQNTIIQKATELGVKGIYPVLSDNCTVKRNIIEAKIDKWQRIALESSKQCERADIPCILQISTLKDVVKGDFDKIIVFAEKYAQCSLKEYLDTNKIQKNEKIPKILIIIGCEGGFSQAEFELFKHNDLPLVSLGNLILRADTATTVALGNLICLL